MTIATPGHATLAEKGWKALTDEERKRLSPVEKARARMVDFEAKSAAHRHHLARLEKLAADQERKRDTKRKIIKGAALDAWATDPDGARRLPPPTRTDDPAQWAHRLLDLYVKRPADRALVGLPDTAALYQMPDHADAAAR